MSKEKEKKHCGGCTFLIGEDIHGYGSCPFDFGELKHCDMDACQNLIDRDEIRHSMAILAQYRRFIRAITLDRGNSIPGVAVPLNCDKISDAIEKVTRYVNVITKHL